MKNRRLASFRPIYVGAAGLLLFLGFWLLFREPAGPGAAPGAGADTVSPLSFPSLKLYVHDGDTKQWTLTLLNATVSPDQRVVKSSSIRNGTFYQNNAAAAHFSAGAAMFNQSTHDLDLSGPIQVDGVNGVHLRAGSLHYSYATHRLRAAGPVRITVTDLSTGKTRSTFSAGQVDADLALDELTFESTTHQPVVLTSRLSAAGAL